MKKITSLFVALLTIITTQSVMAWNNIGHATIAALAERHLTDQAKEQSRKYLKHTLPYYASWMDYWRNCPGFEHTSSWHAFPVDADNMRIQGEENDAAYQITRICKKMRKYHKLKDSIVCDNLKYLIHMVGDMHCPVHVKYVDEPHLKQRSVMMKGKKMGYHTFWDAAIGYFNKGLKADAIAAKYDTLTEAEIEEITKGTPAEWAKVQAEQMRRIYQVMPMHSEVTELTEEEYAELKELTMRQMLRGGYRLAKVLNDIFSK